MNFSFPYEPYRDFFSISKTVNFGWWGVWSWVGGGVGGNAGICNMMFDTKSKPSLLLDCSDSSLSNIQVQGARGTRSLAARSSLKLKTFVLGFPQSTVNWRKTPKTLCTKNCWPHWSHCIPEKIHLSHSGSNPNYPWHRPTLLLSLPQCSSLIKGPKQRSYTQNC